MGQKMPDMDKGDFIVRLRRLKKGLSSLGLDHSEADDALRQARVFQRTLTQNIPDLIWMKDPHGVYLNCNHAFERLYGATEAVIVGKTDYDFVSRDMADFSRQRDRLAAEAGKPLCNEEWLTFADGTKGYFETVKTPVFDTDGTLLGVLGVARDITARHQAEQALRKSQRSMATILDNLPLMAWMKDREGHFLAVNLLFATACGHASPQDLVGKTDLDIWPRDLEERYRTDDEQVIQTGTKKLVEEPIEEAGCRRWFETYKAPLFNEQGEVTGTIGSARDITERKEAEMEREELQLQLQQSQKMESVGRLAGGVAHEFNNMLQIILGNVELLQSQIRSGGPDPSNLTDIRNAAQHAANLTRQLLAYARKQIAMPRALDLNQKVGGMLTMLRRLLGEGVDLRWKLGPGQLMVSIDPSQIDQILVNLILNARDALQVGGQVILEIALVSFNEQDKARPLSLAPGPYICLSVTDTGCGMTDAVLGNIFEPFFTTKPSGQGTGLGLPTVYGIVKQNKGEVVVRSEVGKGSTFQIYLPLLVAVPDTGEVEALQAPAACGQERVLVAEDEEGICRILKRTLESLGYSVQAFASPMAALEAARVPGAKFDLLISDLVMPGMCGCDLYREVRVLHPAIKGLFISGYSEEYIARCGIQEEATAFLPKPFTSKELAEKTRAMLTGELR